VICSSLSAPDIDLRWLKLAVESDPANPYGCCCLGALDEGPTGCTCWEPIYDLEQSVHAPTAPETQPKMCHDCAFRANSPERRDGDCLPGPGGAPFWCHQGMRRVIKWRHPLGMELPAGVGDYRPPIIDKVPYRADGRPGLKCAGWAAQR
jgi:hypothetical protein